MSHSAPGVTSGPGLEGEEELRVGESRHARHGKWHTQRHELSPTPSDNLPLSLTVGGTMGGSGSGIAGPEAKASRVSSQATARPREPWHIQETSSYSPEQMEAAEVNFLPFLFVPRNTCVLLYQRTSSDPAFTPQAPLHSVASRCRS